MVYVGTLLNVVDNSGAERGRCIHIYRKTVQAKPGDKILIAVQRVKPKSKIRKGQVFKGILVCSSYRHRYQGGHFTYCDMNSVILLKKNGDILGSRFKGPIFHKIHAKRLSKALTLAEYLY